MIKCMACKNEFDENSDDLQTIECKTKPLKYGKNKGDVFEWIFKLCGTQQCMSNVRLKFSRIVEKGFKELSKDSRIERMKKEYIKRRG